MFSYKDNTRFVSGITWLVLASVIVLQYVLFKSYLYRDIIGFYPTNHDQAVFLPLTYEIFESMKHGDVFKAMMRMISALPTGIFFPVNALLSFLVTEPARFGALLPNFAYFMILQWVAFVSVRNVTGKNYLGFILLAFILALDTPFLVSGGIADFRMDFIAFCLYGIFTCLVMRSQVFYDRKWSIISAFIVALMILMRCITAIYFVMIVSTLFAYYFGAYVFSKQQTLKLNSQIRLINLILCCLIAAIFVTPCIFINEQALYHYYVVGHITGAERPFRSLASNTDLFEYLKFYPRSVMKDHIGTIGMIAISTAGIFYLLSWLIGKVIIKLQRRTAILANFSWKNEFFFLGATIFCPLFVLTLDPAKSPIVGNIVTVPFLWLMMLFCFYLDKQLFVAFNPKHLKWPVILLASTLLILGVGHQYYVYLGQHQDQEKVKNLSTITKMYMDIGDYAVAKHWSHVFLANDQIIDSINFGCLKTLYYEGRGKLLNAENELLGGTILPISQQQALASLRKSNVAILTIGKYPDKQLYPFYQSVASFRPVLLKYAESHFTRLGDYHFMGYQYRVYVAG
jgi:hypothetical protein